MKKELRQISALLIIELILLLPISFVLAITPSINATIPEFYNQNKINIKGDVDANSKVRLFVNDMSIAERVLDNDETPEGSFEFNNVVLSQDNIIKLWAQDKDGNTNENSYNVSVDTEMPVVELNEIPSAIANGSLTIEGTVNEFVTMNVYLISEDTNVPEKIAGLEAKADNNSVELSWNKTEEDDFSHYVIYRDDVGAIALAKPASYTSYKDVLVNNGESYIYRVSAVNQYGEEGLKSSPATVLILGGETGLPKPGKIDDVIGDIKNPTLTQDINGAFSESITIQDGTYSLKIEFIDKAQNTVLVEKQIILDSQPPEIKITSPSSSSFIYENYANEVDIQGETEPGAQVHLYIERTPLGFLNSSFDVSGLPSKIQNIDESKLNADCRLNLAGTSYCSTGADYSTTADSSGYFMFENIDLTSWASIGWTVGEVSGTEFAREPELEESREARLVFIATDKSGMRNAELVKYSIGTCWAGDFSWDITPLTQFQSPGTLSMERLRENTEEIIFFFNYSYVGSGTNAKINSPQGVTVSKACSSSDMLKDQRFNLSCEILQSGSTVVNPEGRTSYTMIKLQRLEGMDEWLENDWQGFFKAINNELTFPLKVRITYTHDIDGKTITETQTTCQEVTYVLDNSLVDPRKVLPDWVLYDFVDFLDESITTINKVQEELGKVVEYVAIGCVGSFLLRLGWQIYRRWISIFDEKKFVVEKLLDMSFGTDKEDDKKYCYGVAEAIVKQAKGLSNDAEISPKDFGIIKLNQFSNADLKKCFPATAAAWETEAKLYNLYRLSCDRMFGHKTPSKWTEEASDTDLYTKTQSGQGCAVDQSVMGQPLLATKCKDVAKHYHLDPDIYTVDDQCLMINKDGKEALYTIEDTPEDTNQNIYKIKHRLAGLELSSDYVIKQTENTYLTAQDKYCAQVCGIEPEKEKVTLTVAQGRRWNKGNPGNEIKKTEVKGYYDCMPAQECRDLGTKKDDKNEVESVQLRGYTKDCFYKADEKYSDVSQELGNPDSVSDDPNQRYECCCINAIKPPDSKYYQYTDQVKYEVLDSNGQPFQGYEKQPAYAFESKSNPGSEPQGENEGKKWADMEWSYRYWKEKFETNKQRIHNEYNPDRYTSGRDYPACFGLNNWLYDFNAKPGDGNLLIIDPAKQHISAFQCLHITGIYNRLQILKNIMSSLSSCLITVRTTGRADAGVCKELFSQYVCSLIWSIIQFWQDGCLPFGQGFDISKSENKVLEYVSAGFNSVWGSVAESRTELMDEYGNVKLNNLLGTGEDAIARKVCLAAFGYDWELGLSDIVDAAYASSYASLVQKMTGTREFLTIDPASDKARYEYRASWLINPGCDLQNYEVKLSCVSRNEMDNHEGINCEKVNDPAGHNCDCIGLEQEITEPFYSSNTKVAQGNLDDLDWSMIKESYNRYDHLKFTLRPDSSIKSELRDQCFGDGYYHSPNGVYYFPLTDKTMGDITPCHLDPSQGKFTCTPTTDFWTEQGRAQFEGVIINGEKAEREITIFRGDDLVVEPTIRKLQGNSVCLIMELNKQGIKQKEGTLINIDGQQNYLYTIAEDVQPVLQGQISAELDSCKLTQDEQDKEENANKVCKDVIGAKQIRYSIISSSETTEQTTSISFKDIWSPDNENKPDGEITLSSISQDEVIINNLPKQIRDRWDTNLDALVLEYGKTKFKIYTIGFDKKIESADYTLKVEPAEENVEQVWNLKLGLYNTKDDQTDCSTYGEIVSHLGRDQKEEYSIKIEGKAGALKPSISIEKIYAETLLKNDPLEIIAKITSVNKIKNAEYEIRNPLSKRIGKNEIKLDDCYSSVVSNSNREECTITLEKEDLDLAGEYSITVKSEDTNNNPGEATESFEVKCYENNLWGDCKQECDDLGEISNPELKCVEDYKCCRAGEI